MVLLPFIFCLSVVLWLDKGDFTENEECKQKNCTPTCQHALVDDAGARDEHSVARHDAAVGWHCYDVTWHKLTLWNLIVACNRSTARCYITLTAIMWTAMALVCH